eukprot:TRINITY_DN7244_c0_g1_i5.p1 TRINITY_DN7244_c0_g1~~TRINITY_DN7244_c0_g1_i5.p1  ORF type:complete len:521 (+),score=98.77 TRINITY_DN7244_c0_g1_i5:70-1632(+)
MAPGVVRTLVTSVALIGVASALRVGDPADDVDSLLEASGPFFGGKKKKKLDACAQIVPGAMSREGWRPFSKKTCKCPQNKALSSACGPMADERKFDVTRISQDLKDKRYAATVDPAQCRCVPADSDPEEDSEAGGGSDENPVQSEPAAVQGADECGKLVPKALKRTGMLGAPVMGSKKCKCPKDWYLTPQCGHKVSGIRKFDLHEPGLRTEGCKCSSEKQIDDPTNPEVWGPQALPAEARMDNPEPVGSKKNTESSEPVDSEPEVDKCSQAVPGGMKRKSTTSVFSGDTLGVDCKCSSNQLLSKECGRLAGQRKFNPDAVDLKTEGGCICQDQEVYDASPETTEAEDITPVPMDGSSTIDEPSSKVEPPMPEPIDYYLDVMPQVRPSSKVEPPKPESVGERESEDFDVSGGGHDEEEVPSCGADIPKCASNDFPPGFGLGDFVKVVNKGRWVQSYMMGGLVPYGRKWEPAKVEGSVAQVGCPEKSKAVAGRVCLRRSDSRSFGCWKPENLEVVQKAECHN